MIFTQSSAETGPWRLSLNSRIFALDPENPASPKLLSGDFLSACSPAVSYDAKKLLFAAIEKEGEPWQIYEMNFEDLKSRKIFSSDRNCIDPAYLPTGRIAFSKETEIGKGIAGYPVYTCASDGSDIRQITYHPHNNFSSTILKDGRILTISNAIYPENGEPMYLILRPDGTKAELFYKGTTKAAPLSRALETEDGKFMFIESDNDINGGNLVSIRYNRPLHSHENISEGLEGRFKSVAVTETGKYLVAWQPSEKEKYGLYEFNYESKELKEVYRNNEFNVVDITTISVRELPKKLPSEVDTGVKTGLLLCQDINFRDMNTGILQPSATMIRVVGIDSTLGTVPVEKDGSFFLKVKSDTPFQMQGIDANGNVISGTCDWIYLRPNERRGCVGCHEDNEMVPGNRYCLSVSKDPVEIPSVVKNFQEKKIELE